MAAEATATVEKVAVVDVARVVVATAKGKGGGAMATVAVVPLTIRPPQPRTHASL